MKTITDTKSLLDFCEAASSCSYVTVDTEFLRERTYYSKLCLIQLAMPGKTNENAVLIDPFSEGLSLDPLYDLFRDENVVKVFHAARQDLEIFCLEAGVIPKPLFDTQVAAMVCGFGDQVGYETLVNKITNKPLDKSSRFTDWSRRPLSDAQKNYALADVTHLRQIYEFLSNKLNQNGRAHWLEEELQTLGTPETYILRPQDAWQRIKTRSSSPKFLAAVKTLSEFRESYAQTQNVPRNRVLKDDALIELASTRPNSVEDLQKSRLLLREARKGSIALGILKAVAQAAQMPKEALPKPRPTPDRQTGNSALADLLRVLLKATSQKTGVAAKLIASSADLDMMASGEFNIPVMKGWRFSVFGADAQKLCNGQIGLSASGKQIISFPIETGK